MNARRLSLLAAAAAAAALVSIGVTTGAGIGPITSYFLRSEAELDSLKGLLRDPTAWAEIESLSHRTPLWKVASDTFAAAPGEDCRPPGDPDGPPQKARHRFEFASRKGLSSRVYRLDFASCRRGSGEYIYTLEGSGFGSNFHLGEAPLVRGPSPLRVLRLALEDPVVARDLVETLREKDIAFCHVGEDTSRPPEPPIERYLFAAADAMPGEPGLTVMLEYRVEYDPQAGTASFEKVSR